MSELSQSTRTPKITPKSTVCCHSFHAASFVGLAEANFSVPLEQIPFSLNGNLHRNTDSPAMSKTKVNFTITSQSPLTNHGSRFCGRPEAF